MQLIFTQDWLTILYIYAYPAHRRVIQLVFFFSIPLETFSVVGATLLPLNFWALPMKSPRMHSFSFSNEKPHTRKHILNVCVRTRHSKAAASLLFIGATWCKKNLYEDAFMHSRGFSSLVERPQTQTKADPGSQPVLGNHQANNPRSSDCLRPRPRAERIVVTLARFGGAKRFHAL